MASKFQSINNFLKIINIFDRMKLLHKSLLDLVPLSIVTILIAIFASYGLNSLNNDFDKLLSNIDNYYLYVDKKPSYPPYNIIRNSESSYQYLHKNQEWI